jgi:D-psicose/D-tagatose/L-ribulose 3-epimerase
MNMLLWGRDLTGPEHVATFEMLKDAGFEGVEIPVAGADPAKLERLRERLASIGLVPLAVTWRAAAENPISPEPAVRARALAATKADIDACAALGATLLCGPLQAALGVFSGMRPTADERAWAVEGLRPAAEHAESRGVTLALEYLTRTETYLVTDAAQMSALVREVGHPSCRMMYDTFHANIEEKDVRAALRACSDVLVHVHISENDRSTPGSGQVHWDETFAALAEIGYDGWLSIEAFGEPAERVWRPTFESRDQLARDGAAFVSRRLAGE